MGFGTECATRRFMKGLRVSPAREFHEGVFGLRAGVFIDDPIFHQVTRSNLMDPRQARAG